MAIPAFAATGGTVQALTATVAVPVPSGVAANDIIVVAMNFKSFESPTVSSAASGFTAAASTPVHSDSGGLIADLFVYWKRATGADAGTYDFTFSVAASYEIRAVALRYTGGITSGTPFDVTTSAAATSAGTAFPATSLTTTVGDDLVLWAAGCWHGYTLTPPTGFTIDAQGTLAEAGDGIYVASKGQASAGATGSLTASHATSSESKAVWAAALKPAVSATVQLGSFSHFFGGWGATPEVSYETVAIDGGPTYYATNGFTKAAAFGWDDPDFIPIGPWVSGMYTQAYADRWVDVGYNTGFGVTSDSYLHYFADNNICALLVSEPADLAAYDTPYIDEIVGLILRDEPTAYSQVVTGLQNTANAHQDGKMWWLNFLHEHLLTGTITGTTLQDILNTFVATPNTTLRRPDVTSMDLYWCALGGQDNPFWNGRAGMHYGLSAFTPAQSRRSQHYGHHIERMRFYTPRDMPIFTFVENGGPFDGNLTQASYITPAEMNAAVWNSLIHGARGIAYFNSSFAGPGTSLDNISVPFYDTVQSGETISIYDQTKATNELVLSLASVINSPSVLGYATVNPAPPVITFSGTSVTIVSGDVFTGIDFCVKKPADPGKYHIFATNRQSGSVSATFTLAGVVSGTVTVLNESRTLTITAGQFTDTFATKDTVHLYRVE